MRKTITRVVSLLLCLMLALAALPGPAAAEDTVAINATNFPDASFRSYVSTYADKNGDGKLTLAERNAVTAINVQGWYVANMKGVEYFTALTDLNCSYNQLKTLNLARNKALSKVNCSSNQLTTLNITGCSLLSDLDCSRNSIATLNIKNNPRMIHAVKKGIKSTAGGCVSYSLTQTVEHITAVFRLSCDESASLQSGTAAVPKISTQPKNKTANENASVTFSVSASGDGLTYQWYAIKKAGADPVALSGKTSNKLIFTATKAKNGWKVFCIVSGKGGVLYSQAAALKVIAAPTITVQPRSTGGKPGTKLTFTTRASGEKLKYQWYYQKPGSSTWQIVSKGTGPTLTLTAKAAKNGYRFRCLVSNPAGSVYTKTVKLTVK